MGQTPSKQLAWSLRAAAAHETRPGRITGVKSEPIGDEPFWRAEIVDPKGHFK